MFILLKYKFYFNVTNKKNTNIITKEKITKSHADCYKNVNLKKKNTILLFLFNYYFDILNHGRTIGEASKKFI